MQFYFSNTSFSGSPTNFSFNLVLVCIKYWLCCFQSSEYENDVFFFHWLILVVVKFQSLKLIWKNVNKHDIKKRIGADQKKKKG